MKKNPYNIFKFLYHADKLQSIKDGVRTAPVYVRLKPTNICNQSCYYCCYANGNYEGRIINKRDTIPWKKLNEVLNDFKSMGVKALTLSGGGEPLCYPDIDKLLSKIIEIRIDYSILTNGQSLMGNIARKISNANWVRVSLDSANKEHYFKIRKVDTFDKVIENIQSFAKIKKESCELGINFVVTEENCNDVYNICNIAMSIGVNNIKFSPYLLKENSLEYHKKFKRNVTEKIQKAKSDFSKNGLHVTDKYSEDVYFDQESKKCYGFCYIAEYFAVIAADQKVYICHQKAYIPEGEIGDLKNQTFSDMWFSRNTVEKLQSFRPDIICKNVCAFNEKNEILDSIIDCDKTSVNFI